MKGRKFTAQERRIYLAGMPERYAKVYREAAERKRLANATRCQHMKESKERNELHAIRTTSHFLIPQAH